METKNKVLSYIGFALKAGKICKGVNAVETLKNDVFLLIICHTASENTYKDAEKLALKFHCPLIVSEKVTVEEITLKENCKLIALTDKNLAEAVIKNSNEDFTIYSGGRKV